MRKSLGVLIGLIGVVFVIYFAIVIMFVGGVEQFVDGIKADPTDGSDIGWGALRVAFASASAGLGIWISVLFGGAVGGFFSRTSLNRW